MKAITTVSIPIQIEMYGIAVAIKKPKEARLLYLHVNVEMNKCYFQRSLEFFDL